MITTGALGALLIVAVLHLVTSAHFVLHNFQTIIHPIWWENWDNIYMVYAVNYEGIPTVWLQGYRFLVDGWPVIELVLEGFGRLVATACIIEVAGRAVKGELVEEKTEIVPDAGSGAYEPPPYIHQEVYTVPAAGKQ